MKKTFRHLAGFGKRININRDSNYRSVSSSTLYKMENK